MNQADFQRPAGSGRKLFLVLLLLVAVAALGYDFLVAKPAWEEAFNRAQTMQDPKKDSQGEAIQENGRIVRLGDVDGDGDITPKDVKQFLNRAPSTSESPADNTLVETYSWRRGIPFATYDVHVIYSRGKNSTTLYSVSKRRPKAEDLRQRFETRDDRPPGLGVAGGPPKDGENPRKRGKEGDNPEGDNPAGSPNAANKSGDKDSPTGDTDEAGRRKSGDEAADPAGGEAAKSPDPAPGDNG